MNTDSHLPPNFSLITEIKDPLTNINLAINMFESSTDDEEKKLCMAIIKRNTEKIAYIVSKLLEGNQE